jgi:TRAP-type mannitol/chloroaromatic compound transport system substrate-binding protein
MNFKEHRLLFKFNLHYSDETNLNNLKKTINSINNLDSISIDEFMALKYKNKTLFFNIITTEKNILNEINSENNKFKKILKKYTFFLKLLVQYVSINKQDIQKIVERNKQENLVIIKNQNILGGENEIFQ